MFTQTISMQWKWALFFLDKIKTTTTVEKSSMNILKNVSFRVPQKKKLDIQVWAFSFWVNYSFKYFGLHISRSIGGDWVKGRSTMVNRICWFCTQSWLAFKILAVTAWGMPYCYHSDYCLRRFWRTTCVCSRILCSSSLRLSTTHSCSRRDRFAPCLSCDSCKKWKDLGCKWFHIFN